MSSTDFVIERVSASPDAAHLRAQVPADLLYFEGHFEGRPMLPGIAEVLLLVHRRAQEVFGPLGAEKRMVRLKFEAVIVPGDLLDVHLARSEKDGEARIEFRILRGDERCASGAFVYALGAAR